MSSISEITFSFFSLFLNKYHIYIFRINFAWSYGLSCAHVRRILVNNFHTFFFPLSSKFSLTLLLLFRINYNVLKAVFYVDGSLSGGNSDSDFILVRWATFLPHPKITFSLTCRYFQTPHIQTCIEKLKLLFQSQNESQHNDPDLYFTKIEAIFPMNITPRKTIDAYVVSSLM